MSQMATITSKQQLTIPTKIFKKLNWKKGQKVIVSEENGELRIKSALDLIHQLAGSVKIPKRFKGLTLDQIINKAKSEYFAQTYK